MILNTSNAQTAGGAGGFSCTVNCWGGQNPLANLIKSGPTNISMPLDPSVAGLCCQTACDVFKEEANLSWVIVKSCTNN